MSFVELFAIAVGLSMDAFAVGVCLGLQMKKFSAKKTLIIGIYFGVFQAIMPLIGYYAASLFADKIAAYDHFIAFVLLVFLGARMIVGGLKREGCADRECPHNEFCADRSCPGGIRPDSKETSIKPKEMLPLAIATSIDAMAVGVSFAFLQVRIASAVVFIGVTTLLLSVLGVKIGNVFGLRFKSKAEIAGGAILILIGLKILLEHLGIISF